MEEWASIVAVRRDGTDGSAFPVVESQCLFGRLPACHIRIQLPAVSKEHCVITRQPNGQVRRRPLAPCAMRHVPCSNWHGARSPPSAVQVVLKNFGANGTHVNDLLVPKDMSVGLGNGDRITIAMRTFRIELKPVREPSVPSALARAHGRVGTGARVGMGGR